jgi:PQQ-dependent dehydrogenase (methanol/ethanol family)
MICLMLKFQKGKRWATYRALALWICSFAITATARAETTQPVETDWPMAAKDASAMRFSSLDQITAQNASTLKLAWKFDTGVRRGNESAPIVIGQTMYVVTPFPNKVFALDLTRNGALKWQFDPKPAPAAQGVACCDHVSRGIAFCDGKILLNTLDAQTIGIDASTGAEVWRRKLGDISIGETMTMAPFVVGHEVIVGNAGSQLGVRGWIQALNVSDGTTIWKAFNTGPDVDCLIGPNFHPFYEMDRGKDLGVNTWPGEQWKIGGGTVWGWISYDPQLDLIFYGTGDPSPWNSEIRAGDNKWGSGIFARRPATGEAIWYYQYTPHDLYGHDGVNESIVVDLALKPGETKRKVLLHADRNGYLYVMDRTTGEVLSATPFVRINSTTGVDLKTGRLQFVEDKRPIVGKKLRDVAPAAPGGKDWQPSAFSPQTGFMYLPHQTLSMDFEETPVNYIAGTPYIGAEATFYPDPVAPGDGSMGAFTAWDPVARKPVWSIKEHFPVWCGAMVTAGDVVFYGTMDRWFKAVDARTGKVLWKFQVDSGMVGQPIAFLGPDKKQYVSIIAGVGGWPGAIVANNLKPDTDQTTAHGFGYAMRELPKYTPTGGTVYVFALP